MTKMIAIVSAVVLLAAGLALPLGSATVQTDETEQLIVELTGVVQEIADGYYIILQEDGGRVQVNIYNEETLFEGKVPEVGDWIHVLYNGMMTRSLPPQINAMRIGCYVRTGNVVELTETGFTLDDGLEIIEVHADAALMAGLEPGANVTVYFNGAMTMSLPAQISAEMILVTDTIVD